jgi:hypothetical protein
LEAWPLFQVGDPLENLLEDGPGRNRLAALGLVEELVLPALAMGVLGENIALGGRENFSAWRFVLTRQ